MSSEHVITIDREACRKCGLCVEACVQMKLVQPDKSAPPRVAEDAGCISCGHCVAVCPTGALSHSSFGAGSIRPIDANSLPSGAQMMEALRARRSYRRFKDTQVPRHALEQLIEAARLAPSGHNAQTTSFIVVEDPEILKRAVDLAIQFLGQMAKFFRHPIKGRIARLFGGDKVRGVMPMIPTFERIVQFAKAGDELPMVLDAPAWIVFHSAKGAGFGAVNASLAMQNAMLMADRLGLGTFYTGFLVAPAMRGYAMHDLLGLEHDREIHGALGVGVPKLAYKKWPSRKPANVRWI